MRNAVEHTDRTPSVSVSASSVGELLRVIRGRRRARNPRWSTRTAVFDRFHRTDDSRGPAIGRLGPWPGYRPRARRGPRLLNPGGRSLRAPGLRAARLQAQLNAAQSRLLVLSPSAARGQASAARLACSSSSGSIRAPIDHRVSPGVQRGPLREPLPAQPVRVAGDRVDTQPRLRSAGCHAAHRLSTVSEPRLPGTARRFRGGPGGPREDAEGAADHPDGAVRMVACPPARNCLAHHFTQRPVPGSAAPVAMSSSASAPAGKPECAWTALTRRFVGQVTGDVRRRAADRTRWLQMP